jgi:hypothetical protein
MQPNSTEDLNSLSWATIEASLLLLGLANKSISIGLPEARGILDFCYLLIVELKFKICLGSGRREV